MADEPTLEQLRSAALSRLESLWARPVELPAPRGAYWGHVLMRIDHATSRRRLWRLSQTLAFEWAPFGIDFDRRLWFFFHPRLAVGRFEPRVGRSRWRDTDAIGLHYDVSGLPRGVRGVLYDEVKPLSERRLLGIGGINAERGRGDHFFFALERI